MMLKNQMRLKKNLIKNQAAAVQSIGVNKSVDFNLKKMSKTLVMKDDQKQAIKPLDVQMPKANEVEFQPKRPMSKAPNMKQA